MRARETMCYFATTLTIALGPEVTCMIAACLQTFLYTQGKKGVWIKLPRQLIGLAEAAVKVLCLPCKSDFCKPPFVG